MIDVQRHDDRLDALARARPRRVIVIRHVRPRRPPAQRPPDLHEQTLRRAADDLGDRDDLADVERVERDVRPGVDARDGRRLTEAERADHDDGLGLVARRDDKLAEPIADLQRGLERVGRSLARAGETVVRDETGHAARLELDADRRHVQRGDDGLVGDADVDRVDARLFGLADARGELLRRRIDRGQADDGRLPDGVEVRQRLDVAVGRFGDGHERAKAAEEIDKQALRHHL